MGIDSLRGFERDDLSPRDAEGNEIGGNKFVQFNAEVRFPLVPQAGVYGVVFFDTGNVYEDDVDLGDMRKSYGAGIRWFSPMAPIRIEYGQIIDRRAGESEGRWEFTMGGAF